MPTTEFSSTPNEIRWGGCEDRNIRFPVNIVSGQDLVEGTVLGKVTSSGKFKAYDQTNSDGSEVAVAILALDCDASAGDKMASAYVAGVFVESALTGLDDNAKNSLNARSYWNGALILGGGGAW